MEHQFARSRCNPEAGQEFTVAKSHYILGGSLGDGAVGLVRRATTSNGTILRAIKFLAPDPKYVEEDVFDDVAQRFHREGERGAKLKHPNLIEIHTFSDNTNGADFASGYPKNPYIIMEFIRGRTLDSYIRKLSNNNQGKKASP